MPMSSLKRASIKGYYTTVMDAAAKADETEKAGMADRTKIRTVFGGKNMQEILFTK